MKTESTDQPLQSAGPLFTDPIARYRSTSNELSYSHGVVAHPATAINMNQVPNGYCNSTDNNQIITSEYDKTCCPNSTAVVSLTNNIISTPVTFVSSIAVPAGWRRIHNRGVIIYISPSNAVLNSLDQVKIYLQTQGTCKCGLECPFQCERIFNFDPKVMTKPMSSLNTMTNLCNHKRKIMYNNSENRFNKYSIEMAENRKKRKVSVAQQQYSFASYENGKTGKENFSHVSNSPQMQWSDQSTIPSQMRFSPQGTSTMLNPQVQQSVLNSQGPQTMSQCVQQVVPNSQTPPLLNQSSSVMSNSQGPILPNIQNTMASNLQGTVMSNSQGTVMSNSQGNMSNIQSSSMNLGNPRISYYQNHSYQQDLGYEQSYRNCYRYSSSQCRSHETTMLQPDSSCQPHHQQYQNDLVTQEYYPKNNNYQQDQTQYNNYDSQRTQGSCRYNCSSHCGHYCNSNEQNPNYNNQINSFQQPQSQSSQQNESTNNEYYPEIYQEQINYTENYQDNRNNSRQEYPLQYEYELQSQSPCHHMDCNLKNSISTSINNQSPVEIPQIRPQAPQVKLVQHINSQNVQTVTNPLRPQHRSTPPWQLNKHHQSSQQQILKQQISSQQQLQQLTSQIDSSKQILDDRVPSVHHHVPLVSRVEEKTHKVIKQSPPKSVSFNRKSKSPSEEESYPSFLDDPSGYLAQQTALLNNTISTNSFSLLSPPIRPQKQEKPKYTTNVTTMASGRTASSNTITSVLAGRTNTSVVTVNTSEDQVLSQNQQQPVTSKTPLEMVQSVVSSIQVPNSTDKSNIQPSHILLTSNGQLIMASAKIQTPNTSQVLSSVQQVQPTVLVNTLQGTQGTLLLQPGNVMTVDQVQVPQLAVATGNIDNNGAFSPRGSNLLSPSDSKRKTISSKKRKSPQVSPNQNSSSVLLQPQQQNFNQPVVQTLILPNKTAQYGNQQLITNVIQPVNLVHNLPAIQQFIVPSNLGSVVMADNTLLQDTVHLNVIAPFASTGQNILPTGMVLRTSQTQQRPQQSNHQFIVNSVGQLSPIVTSLSPNQSQNQNRNQQQNDYIHVVPCSIQQNQDNTTVVQQNTTIVQQQMTMVSGQQSNEQGNLIINEKQGQNFIIADNKQQGFILSPKDKPQTSGTHFILNNMNSEKQTQSFIITSPTSSDKQLCGNFILEKNNSSRNFIITTNSDKNSKFAKHSVSTQTAAGQQMLQISSTPALIVATNRNAYVGSPPDTTTLSPVSGQSPSAKPEMPSSSVTADLDSALSPSSTLSDLQNRQPMVHCISSSNVVDWSDNSTDERKIISSASDSPNMYSVEQSFPRIKYLKFDSAYPITGQ